MKTLFLILIACSLQLAAFTQVRWEQIKPISAQAELSTADTADYLLIEDVSDSNKRKAIKIDNLPAGSADYIDSLYISNDTLFSMGIGRAYTSFVLLPGGGTETDPVYSAWDKDYNDLSNKPTLFNPTTLLADYSFNATYVAYTNINNSFSTGQTFNSYINVRSSNDIFIDGGAVDLRSSGSTLRGSLESSSTEVALEGVTQATLRQGTREIYVKSDGVYSDLDAATTSNVVYYNSTTKEQTYGAAPSGGGSYWETYASGIQSVLSTYEIYLGGIADKGAYILQAKGNVYFENVSNAYLDIKATSSSGESAIRFLDETGAQMLAMGYDNNTNKMAFSSVSDFYFYSDIQCTDDLEIGGELRDKDGDAGTSGQVLTSTVTGTNWATPNSSPWTDGGTYIYPTNGEDIKLSGTTAPVILMRDESYSNYYSFGGNVGGGSTWAYSTDGSTYTKAIEVSAATPKVIVFTDLEMDGGDIIIDDNAAPTSATATGTKGTIRYDSNYIYICTTTDTWKRAALSTW